MDADRAALNRFCTNEVEWEEGARQLNECANLYAREIRPIQQLALGLIVNEAKAQPETVAPPQGAPAVIAEILRDCKPIKEDPTCRVFELLFEQDAMVSYTILNETYGKYPEPPEEFTGRLFRIFSKSHLLDFTRQTTAASDEYPGVLRHYEIACLNHIIDVVTAKPPRIAVGMWKDES
jgi:hypothetical protein